VAALVTRSALRDKARLYADMRPGGTSEFLTNIEVNGLINGACAELWDRLVALRGHDYFETVNTSLPTVAGTATITLPADFYQLLAFDLAWASDRLEPVGAMQNIADRYQFNGVAWAEGAPKAFRVRGSAAGTQLLELFPTPTTAVNTAIRYVPSFTPIDTGTGGDVATIDGINGWDKSVALRVAIEMRMVAGLSTADLARLYEAELERVDSIATERAASYPARVRDVSEGWNGEDWMQLRVPAS
jgi:hypothetical protein